MKKITVACFGDVIGTKGITVVCQHIKKTMINEAVDLFIVNIENSRYNGKGFCKEAIEEIQSTVGDIPLVFTGGNHSFDHPSLLPLYEQYPLLLRPTNYEYKDIPGRGYQMITVNNATVMVINVQLRTFMRVFMGCPLAATASIIGAHKEKVDFFIIDIHGEATGEKNCFGYFFDGIASLIFGTHTHVQTADERILPKGTAYISDLGMTGALHSSIGEKLEGPTLQILSQIQRSKFEPEESGPFVSSGIITTLTINEKREIHAESIRRLYELFN